ncbi:MAG: penicillin acylase family protein [Chloroflexi bacterium]|nr:penicillin acylase family protein [Chloroflexota bacterium]
MAAGLGKAARRTLDHSSFPTVEGTATVPGTDDRIEIVRDRWGVPHVLASTAVDAFFGHGFVHAQDRLFQMEGARRTAAGRLSEIAGTATLPGDRLIRRVGLNRAARADAERLAGPELELLSAYARGVNAGVECLTALPPEFALFGDTFEPWSVEDTMLVGRLVMFGFAGNWNTELVRERLAAELGPEVAAMLDPVHPPSSTVTGERYPRAARALLEAYQASFGGGLGTLPGSLSSNAWAVSGQRTRSGRPLLASDPHVDVALPGLFHVAHVRGGVLDLIGAGIPGVPGVAIGHNRTIAWGITAGMADVADCYIETFEAPSSTRYRTPDGWAEATEVVERIEVRDAEAIEERVLVTRHGPVVSPALRGERRAIALRSSVVEGQDIATPFIALSLSSTFAQANRAVDGWPSTTFNFVLASTDGHIGYRFVGQVPDRAPNIGLFPQEGATSPGPPPFIGVDELPRLIDPPSGFVASANNAPGGEHELGEEWCDPQRWERIVERIEAREVHTVASFCAIQRDRHSTHLERLRDVIVRCEAATPVLRGLIEGWDGHLDLDSAAGALLHTTYRVAGNEMMERVAGGRGRIAMGASVDGVPVNSAFAYRFQGSIIDAVQHASAPWFVDEADRDRRLAGAVERATEVLTHACGDSTAWSLGALQTIPFEHALASVPGVGRQWSRGSRPFGGDVNTVVQAQGSAWGRHNRIRIAPGYRQVLDLGDWDASLFMQPTGNSGIPGHPRYDDCIDEYVAGAYRPLLFNELAIRAVAESTLILERATVEAGA